MLFLVVNFHYIHEEDKYPFPGIYSIPREKLSNQLEQLGQYFDFISQNDLVDAVEGKKILPERCCLVTFDDGLKSQYENALPVLQRKRIPAIFFVNTLPIREKKVCLVHKIHWLRANLALSEFLKKIDYNLQLILGKSLNNYSVDENKAIQKYRYDEPSIAKLKFILNHAMPARDREKIIDKIFGETVHDEADFCEKFYLSEKEIRDLSERSFLGIHSDSHQSLSQLLELEIIKDINESLKTLYDVVDNKKIISISYPYGDKNSVSLKVVKVCQSLNLKLGFTAERAFNRGLERPLLFARMDTNDILGGRHQAFTFEHNRIKFLENNVTPSRTVYFQEKYEG